MDVNVRLGRAKRAHAARQAAAAGRRLPDDEERRQVASIKVRSLTLLTDPSFRRERVAGTSGAAINQSPETVIIYSLQMRERSSAEHRGV